MDTCTALDRRNHACTRARSTVAAGSGGAGQLIFVLFLVLLSSGIAKAQELPAESSTPAQETLRPHLEMRHGARQLVVDGHPFLILGGELHESTPSSEAYMEPIWPRLVEENLNTVVASISWELLEPEEGDFDFSEVDNLIAGARKHHLHLVLIWFGSWKNGESSYAPYWVKIDPARFPLAQNGAGKNLNILSTFGAASLSADSRAFTALMHHIRQVDGRSHTVLAIQVENEVGILGDSRDRSPAANEAYNQPVPQELMRYLASHKDSLAPELRQVWADNGYRTSGSWSEIFGPGQSGSGEKPAASPQRYWPADEIFMAWNYARYVGKVAAAGKAEYDIPMYANAWLHGVNQAFQGPGGYPSGGPVQEIHDIWRAGAPAIDMFAPDLYPAEFDAICERFIRNGNPLFIAETAASEKAPDHALDAFLKYNAISFSPFGVDDWYQAPGHDADGTSEPVNPLSQTYAVLKYLSPLILENQGKDTMVILDGSNGANDPSQQVKLGNYTLTIRYEDTVVGSAAPNSFPRRLVFLVGPDDYVFVGSGMRVTFSPNTPGPPVRMASFDESVLVHGQWAPGRRLNGGQSDNDSRWPSMHDFGIYRIRVYRRE